MMAMALYAQARPISHSEAYGIASGFIAGKYAAQAARFEKKDLRKAVEDCVEAEEAIKTGRMNDNMSVELLIIRYSA